MFSAHSSRVSRRVAHVIACATLMFGLVFTAAKPVVADSAAGAAYSEVASWLFEQYLQQAIKTMTFNVKNVSPEAGRAIEAEAPSMQRFLSKHRTTFVTALVPILQSSIDATRVVGLVKTLKSSTELDAETKQQLAAVDTTFRLDEQRVLRAMTFDLRLLVEDILQTIKKPPQ